MTWSMDVSEKSAKASEGRVGERQAPAPSRAAEAGDTAWVHWKEDRSCTKRREPAKPHSSA